MNKHTHRHTHTHTHMHACRHVRTHTHILIPFEDREPARLKLDIAVCQTLIWPSSYISVVDMHTALVHCCFTLNL